MKEPCTRFEDEGLPAWELGEALDPHFDSCPDCLEARKAYEATIQKIENLEVPPLRAEWRARLWAGIERPPWWRRWARGIEAAPVWVRGAGIAAVLTTALLLPVLMSSNDDASLRWQTVPNPDVEQHRGELIPGDSLRLEAATGNARFFELRVYYNRSELFFRCSGPPECERDGDELAASVTLPRRGTYHPVLLVSDRPLPEPSRGRDADLAAALREGAIVRSANASANATEESVEVR